MKTKDLALSGIFLALLIICSWIIIPIGPVPVSLSVLAIFLLGAMLSPFNAIAVCCIYLLLGIMGIPVFSGFGAGIAKILGPTGGYLISYPFMAAAVAFAVKFGKKYNFYVLGMSIALLICYTFGAAYLAISLNITLKGAIISGVVPFILIDIPKIVIASALAYRLNIILSKQAARGNI
ncbi:MAG: biotin transporter BioY [Clostridia bacterium]|nr:biotin transporter BioY [Clostridia bacterium]